MGAHTRRAHRCGHREGARDGGERQTRLTKAGYRWETVTTASAKLAFKKGGCKRDRNYPFSKQELDREVRDVVTEMSGVT